MKKVYTTIILFVSLFFFCSHNANALVISDDTLNLINEDFFKVRELANKHCSNNSQQYFVIRYSDSYSTYIVEFFNDPYTIEITRSNGFNFKVSVDYYTNPLNRYKYTDNNLIYLDKYSYSNYSIDNSGTGFTFYLYSNFPVINTSSSSAEIYYYSSDDYPYMVEVNSKFLSLYEHYLNINGLTDEDLSPDIHKEEKEILSNFYTLVIEKINLLANSIIENYIYLTIIGLFILIFLIYLIRRYLL